MLSQSAYLFIAKVLGYGIRILLPVFLVRILTKADFGLYNQFFLIEIMFKTIFQMGVNQSQFFFIPRDLRNSGAYFINSLMLNVVLFGVAYSILYFFRGDLAEFLGMPVLEMFFWLLAGYSLLMMLNVTAETYLIARKLFIHSAVFEILRQVLASIATLLAAYLTRDLRIIILALVASRALSLALALIYIHVAQHGFRAERYFFGIRSQIRYGLVLGAAGMAWTFLMRFNEMTVSKFYDIETYAVYAAGLKQIPILQFFNQSIASVALVRFATLEKENDWENIRKFWDQILGSMYGLAIPLTLLFLLISKPLVLLMFTREYADAVIIFRINTIAMLFYILNPTLVLRAMNRNDISLKVHLGLLLLMPPALYAGMTLFGLPGIIGAHAVIIIGGRIINHSILNRMAPVYLPYIASRKSVMDFYSSSFQKSRAKILSLLEK